MTERQGQSETIRIRILGLEDLLQWDGGEIVIEPVALDGSVDIRISESQPGAVVGIHLDDAGRRALIEALGGEWR